ncbi:MAG: ATP-grasp domain-containing protein [Eubacteriales bacterium]|nr:ATP-grasp domain-containing protein [Eubacteriales bacterium]
MKNFVIIGANDFQRPLIRKAKDMGYTTHVFAWREGAVGAEDADFFYEISITQKEEILEICRRLRPEGVATIGSDLANITVQYVSEGLGLPGNARDCIWRSTNKYAMRRAFREAGLPVPYFAVAKGEDEVRPPVFPVVVKPTDRSGSRAITRVECQEDLKEAIQRACSQSFEGRAMVEGYLEGQEYSMETISFEGRHTCLAITRKFTTGSPHYIETGHMQPALLTREEEEGAKEMVFAGLDALGVRCGAGHSEFRIDRRGRIRIIEIGSRMGGDCIGSHLVPLSTGEDFVKMVVDCAVGRPPRFSETPRRACAAIRFIMEERDLALYEKIRRTAPQAIREFVQDGHPGERTVTDSGSRFGFFILQTETAEEMESLWGGWGGTG